MDMWCTSLGVRGLSDLSVRKLLSGECVAAGSQLPGYIRIRRYLLSDLRECMEELSSVCAGVPLVRDQQVRPGP